MRTKGKMNYYLSHLLSEAVTMAESFKTKSHSSWLRLGKCCWREMNYTARPGRWKGAQHSASSRRCRSSSSLSVLCAGPPQSYLTVFSGLALREKAWDMKDVVLTMRHRTCAEGPEPTCHVSHPALSGVSCWRSARVERPFFFFCFVTFNRKWAAKWAN